MRRERGPRLDMEPVDGSGKGVGEDDEREKAKPSGERFACEGSRTRAFFGMDQRS